MKKILLRTLFVLIPHSFAVFAFGQAGTLDSSFGINGKVTSSFSPYSEGFADMALQNDGSIVSVGTYFKSESIYGFLVVRHKPNGTLDSSFGTNGRVITYVDSVSPYLGLFGMAVAIQPDGKIVIGGSKSQPGLIEGDFALARYLSNGRLDPTFGSGGIIITDVAPNLSPEAGLTCLALQSDGKILAGGFSAGLCLIRYQTNGAIDPGFGINGKIQNLAGYDNIYDIAVLDNGKILTAGTTPLPSDIGLQNQIKISRFTTEGKLDSTFGENGEVKKLFFDRSETASSLSVTGEKILVCGNAFNPALGDFGRTVLFTMRLNENGSFDTTYGTNGGRVYNDIFQSSLGTGLKIQPDGKFLIAGGQSIFQVKRFNRNGDRDLFFGTNGFATATFSSSAGSSSVLLQPDGKIIVGGYPSVSLARFKADEALQVALKKSISVVEGNAGTTTPAQFLVILNKKSTVDVLVDYTTKNVNAIAGSDYTTTSGTLRIKAGKLSGNIVVPVIGDNVREVNEKFALVLSNPVNALAGVADSVVCTIRNDDAASLNVNATAVENINVTSGKIKLFPNPAHDVLNLQGLSANEKAELTIFDLTGKAVMKQTISITNLSWNISRLANGKYILQIATGTFIQNMPFIKQ